MKNILFAKALTVFLALITKHCGLVRILGRRQVNRYMGWVKSNLAREGDKIEGLIIAKEMSDKLKFALIVNSNIKFMEYEIDFQLKTHDVVH